MSLRTKLILLQVAVLFALMGVVSFFLYQQRTRQILEEFQAFVRSVAGTTALKIDAADVTAVRSLDDVSNDAFLRIRDYLEQIRKINGLKEGELYVLRPLDPAQLFDTEFVVMVHQKPFVGDRYTIREENRKAFAATWNTGIPHETGAYKDEHGEWISGYGAIRDATGKTVAILEADAEISRLSTRTRGELIKIAEMMGGVGLVTLLIIFLITHSMTSGLVQLSREFQAVGEGRFPESRTVQGTDEVGRLGEAFYRMLDALQESWQRLDQVVHGLRRNALLFPSLAMESDRESVANKVLAELVECESLRDAELTLYYFTSPDLFEQNGLRYNEWPPDRTPHAEENFPFSAGDKVHGELQIKLAREWNHADKELCQIWCQQMGAVLGSINQADQFAREQQLQVVNTTSTGFVHSLKTPINRIRRSLDAGSLSTPEGLRDVGRSLEEIEKLMRDLSIDTKEDSGILVEEVPLDALLNQCLADYQRETQGRVRVEYNPPESLPVLRAARSQLVNILFKLLRHLEFQQRIEDPNISPVISVAAAQSDSKVTLLLFDSRPKSAASLRPKTGPLADSDDSDLVLSMARVMIQTMGGQIMVERRPALGYVITLPHQMHKRVTAVLH